MGGIGSQPTNKFLEMQDVASSDDQSHAMPSDEEGNNLLEQKKDTEEDKSALEHMDKEMN